MELKVLVTGRNRRIAVDVCEHLENDRGITPLKCPPKKSALLEVVLSEMPQVIIICMKDESSEEVKVFDVLKESARAGAATIIVVASPEDRKLFITHTGLRKIYFLSRPISLMALYTKLDDIEQNLEKTKENSLSMLTEYINENAVEEFPRKHILVVDDDSEQLYQIKEHLSEFYEVTLVNKGKNVFRFLEKFKVDLILLDYMMPEMDGPEVLMLLRAHPDYRKIPVIFLTGVSEKEVVIKTLLELKPQGYILKPSKKSELVAQIIDILG